MVGLLGVAGLRSVVALRVGQDLDFWLWCDCGGVGLLGIGTSGGVRLLSVVGLLWGWEVWGLGVLGG